METGNNNNKKGMTNIRRKIWKTINDKANHRPTIGNKNNRKIRGIDREKD